MSHFRDSFNDTGFPLLSFTRYLHDRVYAWSYYENYCLLYLHSIVLFFCSYTHPNRPQTVLNHSHTCVSSLLNMLRNNGYAILLQSVAFTLLRK